MILSTFLPVVIDIIPVTSLGGYELENYVFFLKRIIVKIILSCKDCLFVINNLIFYNKIFTLNFDNLMRRCTGSSGKETKVLEKSMLGMGSPKSCTKMKPQYRKAFYLLLPLFNFRKHEKIP